MKYRNYIKTLKEETTSADIATIDTKLDLVKRAKHLDKGKKCKKHKMLNCELCEDDRWDY